jgi:hypothetical protein
MGRAGQLSLTKKLQEQLLSEPNQLPKGVESFPMERDNGSPRFVTIENLRSIQGI